MPTKWTLPVVVVLSSLAVSHAEAQLTWSLAGGSEGWPAWARDAVMHSMDEAVAIYNTHGFFDKHVTANYNPGVPTAQGNYDGWIDFGGSYNTRVAIHEIAHTLGTGYYWATGGGAVNADTAAGRLEKLYDGQAAGLSTGGTHFWPYGLNYDNEDGPAARERHCKLVAAFRFDSGIVKDSDGDGLPDDWERHHFQGLDETGAGDADADGISNLDEYGSDADPKQPCPVRDGVTYVVRNQRSGRALTPVDAGLAEGTRLALHTPDGSTLQQWTAHYVGKGFFRFTPAGSERVLQTPGPDTASGRPLELASWTSALSQQWRVVSGAGAEPEHFQIASRETARVVDGLDAAEGAAAQQYPFLGDISQQFWRFEQVGADGSGADAGAETDAGAVSGDSGVVGGADAGDSGVPGDAAASADAARPADLDGAVSAEPDAGDAHRAGGGCTLSVRASRDGTLWSAAGVLGLLFAVRRRRRSRARGVAAPSGR